MENGGVRTCPKPCQSKKNHAVFLEKKAECNARRSLRSVWAVQPGFARKNPTKPNAAAFDQPCVPLMPDASVTAPSLNHVDRATPLRSW